VTSKSLTLKSPDPHPILWDSFRSRLGVSEFTHMYFDLSSLLHSMDNLHILVEPFSREEINGIIKNLPSEKSPGPYGFNYDFMKKCWPTISIDFYDLFLSFYDHNINIQSINGSYITLIPKVSNPTRVNDYRPISLLNSSIKLITKLVADRLQTVILKMIHRTKVLSSVGWGSRAATRGFGFDPPVGQILGLIKKIPSLCLIRTRCTCACSPPSGRTVAEWAVDTTH
jgi:hypothetical protein